MYLSEPSGTAVRAVHGAIWPLYFRLTISHFLAKNTGNMKRYTLGAGLEGIYFSVVTTQQQIHKRWSLVSTDQGCQNPGLEGRNQTGFYLGSHSPWWKLFLPGWIAALRDRVSTPQLYIKPPDVIHGCDTHHPWNCPPRLSGNVPTGQSRIKMVPYIAALYLMSLSHLLYQCISPDHMCWGKMLIGATLLLGDRLRGQCCAPCLRIQKCGWEICRCPAWL